MVFLSFIFSSFTAVNINPIENDKTFSEDVGSSSGELDNAAVSPEVSTDASSGVRGSSRGLFDPYILDSRVEYAIIAADQFHDELQPLAQWKTRKGVAAKIFSLEEIYGNYLGKDKAQKVHNFLRELDTNSNYLQYVLLAGDADANVSADDPPLPYVPSRYLYSGGGASGVNDYYCSDVYFAGLSGNWDNDNDEIYGEFSSTDPWVSGISTGTNGEEADHNYEAYVGRLPGDTGAEMTTMVNKILRYEQDPPAGNWLKTSVFWGGLMDAPNIPQYENDSWNAYEVKHFRAKPEMPSHMIIDEYYDYPQLEGGSYTPATDNLNRANAIATVNSGASIINFAGQAYYEGWALLEYNDPPGLKRIDWAEGYGELYWYTDGGAATNGDKLPLVYMSGCDAAVFNFSDTGKDRSQERMLTNPNGGAIGLISSTAHTFRGEEHGDEVGNWWLDEYYWKIMFEDKNYQVGKALYKLKEKYYTDIENGDGKDRKPPVRSNTFGYILLGDPELWIRTDTARVMNVEADGLFVGAGEAIIKVKDLVSGAPVEGALVNIMNTELYVQGWTNETGVVKIPIEPFSEGAVEIIVTAYNYLPRELESSITQKPVDLSVVAADISIDPDPALDGSEAKITARIYNYGGVDQTTTATVRFYIDDPTKAENQIGLDQTVNNVYKDDFELVSIKWEATYRPDDYKIYVWIDPDDIFSEYTRDNNLDYISVSVLSSDLKVEVGDISLSPLTVGEHMNITANITVRNVGSVDARNIKVSLYDGDPLGSGKLINTLLPSNIQIPLIFKNHFANFEVKFRLSGGEHDVYVFADSGNTTFEMDEENNIAYRNITVNFAPMLTNLNDVIMYEDTIMLEAFDLYASKHIFDPDTDTTLLQFSVKSIGSPEDLSVTINENRYVKIEPADNFSSKFPIEVIIEVTDGLSSDTEAFNVTVRSVQDKPFVEDLDVLTYQQSETIIIMLNASDADGDPLFFYDDTELFDIHEFNGEINFTANRDMAGTYDIIITVSDGDLQTEMEFTLVIERFNRPPDLQFIKDVTVKVGQEISIEVIATDPDDDPLEFTTDPPIFTVTKDNETSATLKYTPTKHDIGPKNIIIRASDGLEDDSQTILVTVVEDNDADDKGFFVNPLFLSILLIIVIVIVIVVFMTMRKKKQADRDIKAWGSLETVELEDDEVGYDVPPEQPERRDGEYSVIEEELMGGTMQTRSELEGVSAAEQAPMSLPPTAETLYPETAETKVLTTPPMAETEIVLKPTPPPPPPPPPPEEEVESETEAPKKPRPVKKKVKKKR